jgi:hypothetical protein
MAWYKDMWCVLTVIELPDKAKPLAVLSIHRTKEDAKKLAGNLVQNDRWPTTTRLMKYTRNMYTLKIGDILCGHEIDGILNYFERELNIDVVREKV